MEGSVGMVGGWRLYDGSFRNGRVECWGEIIIKERKAVGRR